MPSLSLAPRSVLPSRYYHVTEREDAQTILQEGFLGGWGDVGFGVYVYASLPEATAYAARGGWDGRLKDPVLLVLEDDTLERVIPDPSWPASKYDNMYWKDLEDGDEEAHWRPHSLALHVATPDRPAPPLASAPAPRRSRRIS